MSSPNLGATLVFGVLGLGIGILCAPAVAAAIGGAGLLGVAGTGTAIAGLSGAALTSASLAAIGGSVFAGTVVVSGVSATTAATIAAYCSSLENKKYDEVCSTLRELKKKNKIEMEQVFNSRKNEMSEEERNLWEAILNEA